MEATHETDRARREPRSSPVTFELAVYGWTGSDTLEIGGRWRGVQTGELQSPELVIRRDGRTFRLQAIEAEGADSSPDGTWVARFKWSEGPVSLDAPRLEFPDGKVVQLPALKLGRTRFGRQRRVRLSSRDGSVPVADEAASAVAAPAPAHGPGEAGDSAAPAAAPDALRLYEELAGVRDELETTREELEHVREEALRARHDAERAAERRAKDAERLHADLEATRVLGHSMVAREREERETAERTLAQTVTELEAARAESARLAAELEDVRGRAHRADELEDALSAAEERARVAEAKEHRVREAVRAIAELLDEPLEPSRLAGGDDTIGDAALNGAPEGAEGNGEPPEGAEGDGEPPEGAEGDGEPPERNGDQPAGT